MSDPKPVIFQNEDENPVLFPYEEEVVGSESATIDALLVEATDLKPGTDFNSVENYIREGGQDAVRMEAKQKKYSAVREAIIADLTATGFYQGDVAKTEEALSAIERANIAGLTESVDQSDLMGYFYQQVTREEASAEEPKTVLEQQRNEWAVKRQLLLQAAAQERETGDQQNFVAQALDFLGSLVPTQDATAVVGVVPGQERPALLDELFNSQELSEDASNLLYKMPLDEFVQKLPDLIEKAREQSGFISQNPLQTAKTLTNLANPDEDLGLLTNIDLGLTLFGVASSATKSAINTFKNVKALSPAKGNEILAKAVADKAINPDSPLYKAVGGDATITNEVNLSLTGGADALRSFRDPGAVSEAVIKATETSEKAAQAFVQNNIGTLIDEPADIARAISSESAEVTAFFAGKKEKVIDIVPEKDFNNGLLNLNVILGKKDKTVGFKTIAAAKASADRRDFVEGDYNIVKRGNEYFISHKKTVDQSKYIPEFNLKEVDRVGALDRYLTGAYTALNLETNSTFLQAMGKRSKAVQAIRPAVNLINKLDLNQKKQFSSLINEVEKAANNTGTERWFNREEMVDFYRRNYDRSPTAKEMSAYQGYIKINDAIWSARNRAEYNKLSSKGFVSGDFSDPSLAKMQDDFFVKEIQDTTGLAGQRAYDAGSGEIVLLTADDVAKYSSEGKRFLVTDKVISPLGDNLSVKYIVGSKDATKLRSLKQNVIGYRVGGPRVYDERLKFAVKQARVETLEDGSRLIKSERMITLTDNVNDANKFAKQMEVVRTTYNDFKAGVIDITQANKLFVASGATKALRTTDFSEVAALFDKGFYNAKSPFEALSKSEKPTEMLRALQDRSAKSLLDEFELDDVGGVSSRGQFYSRRGERLIDINGSDVATLNPLEALDKSLAQSIDINTFNNFKERFTIAWDKTFGQRGVDIKDSVKTGYEKIMNDIALPNLTKEERRIAEAQRSAVKRLLQYEHPLSFAIRTAAEDLGETLQKSGIPGMEDIGKAMVRNSDIPVQSKIKGLAFHAYLGLFNWGSVAVQPFQTLLLSTAYGVTGVRSLRAATTMQYALWYGTRDVAEELAKKKYLHGMDPKEYMQLYDSLDESGYAIILDTISDLDRGSRGALSSGSKTFDMAKSIASKGTVFFNETERLNRITAFNLAWRKLKEQGVDLASVRGKKELLNMADAFNFRMSDLGKAQWQQAPFVGALTQFMSYPARYFEIIFGKNKAFSGADRARLVVASALLTGSQSFPKAQEALDTLAYNYNIDIHPGWYKLYSTGVLDAAIYAATDGEVNISYGTRVGVGSQIMSFLEPFASDAPRTSLLGNTPGIGLITNLYDATKFTLKLAAQENTPLLAVKESTLRLITNNVASLSLAQKSYLAYKYGEYYTKSGASGVKLTPPEIFATWLSIPPGQYTDQWRAKNLINDSISEGGKIKAEAKFASDLIKQIQRKYYLKPGDVLDEAKEAEVMEAVEAVQAITTMVADGDIDTQKDLIRFANRDGYDYLISTLDALSANKGKAIKRSLRTNINKFNRQLNTEE